MGYSENPLLISLYRHYEYIILKTYKWLYHHSGRRGRWFESSHPDRGSFLIEELPFSLYKSSSRLSKSPVSSNYYRAFVFLKTKPKKPYLINTPFLTLLKLPASSLKKYIPLESPSPLNCAEYSPACLFPLRSVCTSLPSLS